MLSKRFGASTTSLGPLLGDLGSLSSSGNSSNGLNPYEKWSNGTDKIFMNGSNGDSQNQVKLRFLTWRHHIVIYAPTC